MVSHFRTYTITTEADILGNCYMAQAYVTQSPRASSRVYSRRRPVSAYSAHNTNCNTSRDDGAIPQSHHLITTSVSAEGDSTASVRTMILQAQPDYVHPSFKEEKEYVFEVDLAELFRHVGSVGHLPPLAQTRRTVGLVFDIPDLQCLRYQANIQGLHSILFPIEAKHMFDKNTMQSSIVEFEGIATSSAYVSGTIGQLGGTVRFDSTGLKALTEATDQDANSIKIPDVSAYSKGGPLKAARRG
ncbi:hypothetical protein BGX26_006890 [Mortierella sp. AD094]|nr:hypothetical protein BGX26_006890 [Mortierella sp. AD094]